MKEQNDISSLKNSKHEIRNPKQITNPNFPSREEMVLDSEFPPDGACSCMGVQLNAPTCRRGRLLLPLALCFCVGKKFE
jgi:hypothetical protein